MLKIAIFNNSVFHFEGGLGPLAPPHKYVPGSTQTKFQASGVYNTGGQSYTYILRVREKYAFLYQVGR
jgi:hypothetical protein